MFNFKKHKNTLTIRDLTNKLFTCLGRNATVTFDYACAYPNTEVTDLFIHWEVTRDEVYTVRFDADYVDEILKDDDLAFEFASSLAFKFKQMQKINQKIEEGTQSKESA